MKDIVDGKNIPKLCVRADRYTFISLLCICEADVSFRGNK